MGRLFRRCYSQRMAMKNDEIEKRLKETGHAVNEGLDVADRSSHLSQESTRLCNAARQKFREAGQALDSRRFVRFLRLYLEGDLLRWKAFRLRRKARHYLRRGEKALSVATRAHESLISEFTDDT